MVSDAVSLTCHCSGVNILDFKFLPRLSERTLPPHLAARFSLPAVSDGARNWTDHHQPRAVLEALVGKQTAFARTPKYRVESKKDRVGSKKYRKRLGWVPGVELLIGPISHRPSIYAIANENYITVPFLLLFVVGYWYTGLMSLLQGRFAGVSLGSDTHTKPFPVGV